MSVDVDKKCKHPNCTCQASEGSDYCSVQCESAKEIPDIDCKCAHPGCNGRAVTR